MSKRTVRPFDLIKKYVPGAPPSRASEEDAAARLAICKTCPMFRKKMEIPFPKHSCRACNCFMPEKVKLADAVCPLGKWEAVEAVS